MNERRLSIVMPVFNEEGTIRTILDRINTVTLIGDIEKELIVVDDGSTDRTSEIVRQFTKTAPALSLRYIRHSTNQGKGAALQTGIPHATGQFLIIQDADLEYDPAEYNSLLKPVLHDVADVVYGSRFAGGDGHRAHFSWHSVGNRFLTFLSNLFTNLNLTDMETCYKLFRREVLQQITLHENRFGFDPEVTAKVARISGIRIHEVGISYFRRGYGEGKKIGWKDGLRSLYCILKYNLCSERNRATSIPRIDDARSP